MQNNPFKKSPFIAYTILTTFIIITSFVFLTKPSIPLPSFQHSDKLLHFIFYASLTYVSIKILKPSNIQPVYLTIFSYGVIIEILQFFSVNRSFEIADIIANGLGIYTATLIIKKYF